VLLHLESPSGSVLDCFDELEQLRIYLNSFSPTVCSIRLISDVEDIKTLDALQKIDIEVFPIEVPDRSQGQAKTVAERLSGPLRNLLTTALALEADCIASNSFDLMPYVEDFAEAGVLLTS
jgi:hypothetical protein